jgi:hypothetical protein
VKPFKELIILLILLLKRNCHEGTASVVTIDRGAGGGSLLDTEQGRRAAVCGAMARTLILILVILALMELTLEVEREVEVEVEVKVEGEVEEAFC